MSDFKRNSGFEYLRYLKFIIDRNGEESDKELNKSDFYSEMFPVDLDLERKSKTEWSHTSRKEKIKRGLKLYKIELPNFTDFRFDFHSHLSSTAHGNKNTIYTFMRTPEENRPKLEADLTLSIAHFETTLQSALRCYVHLYLGKGTDYRGLVKSIYPDK